MPIKRIDIDFGDEVDRLTDEMERLAEEHADLPFDSEAAAQLSFQGQQRERYRTGIQWAREEWAADSITIGALTDGERRIVADLVDDSPFDREQCKVAVATVDAPFVAHDPDAIAPAEARETAANVADLEARFVDWLEHRVSDVVELDDDLGNSYARLVAAKRAARSTEPGGSDTAE